MKNIFRVYAKAHCNWDDYVEFDYYPTDEEIYDVCNECAQEFLDIGWGSVEIVEVDDDY